MCLWPCLYGDCECLHVCMHVCDWARLYDDRVAFVCVSGNDSMVIVCGRGCMHVCVCVCLYGDRVVFAFASGHVCMVIVGVCVGVCMLVNVCGCMVIVLCLYVSPAMFVW